MTLFQSCRQAAAATGRPLAALLLEALRLRFGGNRLGLSEYMDFRLHEADLSGADKAMFGGARAQAVLEELLIDDYARFLSLDKLSMYALLRGHGFAVPALRATYRSLRPSSVTQLHTPQALAAYLRAPGALPVYLKRSFGAYGRGNRLVTGLQGDSIVFGNADTVPLAEFCASLDDGRSLGWLLQQPLQPHAEIVALTGTRKISGLRVHSFLTPRGARLTRAIFKINAGELDSDNFEHGASGNLLGAVDIDSGRIVRSIAGTGAGQRVNPPHPVTGRALTGFVLPHWPAVRELVLDAHRAFPGFICPGWDIALCPEGPVIMEVNAFGDIDLSQHACRRGFLDDEFRALLAERGLLPLLRPGAAGLHRSPRNHRLGRRKHHWPW